MQLALALNDVLCVLRKARRQGVAIGVSPGAELASAALFVDRSFDLRKNLFKVALLFGQVDAQRAGVAHQRGRQVGFDEVAAVLKQLLQQRLGVRVIRAEVSSVLAVFLDPLRNLLKDISLRTGNTDVSGRVGRGLKDELHAKLLARSFHDGSAAAHGLIGHVAREGDVDEGVAAELMRSADDQVAAGYEVVVADEVGSGADLGEVLMGLAGDADDIGAAVLDLAERFGGARDGLVNDDRLHERVIRHVNDGLDGSFQLFGEVVGVDCESYLVFTVCRLERFRAAAVVLGLGNRTGYDADVPIFGAFCIRRFVCGFIRSVAGSVGRGALGRGNSVVIAAAAGCKCENHRKRQQQA